MPAYSTLKTFVKSLKTGDTNITQVLGEILKDRQDARDQEIWPTFRDTPDLLKYEMPVWLRAYLRSKGMRDDEIDHIHEHWPPEAKEEARQWIAEAIENDYQLRFSWELHEGRLPENELRDDGRRVVFRSPREGVRISGLHVSYIHIGGVHVNR